MNLRLALLGGAVVGVAVLGAGAAVAGTGDGIPRGTTVRTVDVGGLSRAEAVEKLERSLDATSPISLLADGEVLPLDPAAAGLDLDAEATVERALDVGFVERVLSVVSGPPTVDPVPAVDEPRLRSALTSLAEGFDRTAREGAVRFTSDGVPVEAPPLTGRRLDVPGAARALRSSYLSSRVEVPVDVTPVETTLEDVREARDEVAVPAVAAPVVVQAGGDSFTVEPLDIAKALRLEAVDGKITPRLDAEVLHERVERELRAVGTPVVEATFDVSSGTPVVVPSRTGRSVSAPDLAAAVMEVLTDEAPRRTTAPLTLSEPRVSTSVAKGLGVREVIGTYTTRHPCCRPRVENIHRVAEIVDGYVLRPGDRFDLNGFVGPRDEARGFKSAPMISDGQFIDAVGGGISQFATTIFNTVFFSGLKDITHTPHSYWIRRYPPGREATVSFPKPDFIFENDSPHGVYIDTSFTDTSITVTFWGTQRFDEIRSETGPKTRLRDFGTEYVQRDDCTATEGEQGFDIVVTRVFVDGGKEVRREDFKTRYKPEPRFICGAPPKRR